MNNNITETLKKTERTVRITLEVLYSFFKDNNIKTIFIEGGVY